ncbi:GAF domain-containing protein [Variovorax sp. H27-G14]|uniref:GAF domain-containing protein n=1 Tax=Variovorax sp. H27-G14 TaxID=3111914 RepID=UPI0038FD19BB
MYMSSEAISPLTTALCSNLFDAAAQATDLNSAMRQIDSFMRLMVGPVTFSINLNVTTADDPANEVQLQRFYSSNAGEFPVAGRKRKTLTPWTETLFARGQVFVAEGSHELAEIFDDYDRMAPLGLNAVINVPILQGNICFATFNVFGVRGRWLPHEVVTVRLLALLVARWVVPAPGLHYSLGATKAGN